MSPSFSKTPASPRVPG